MASLFPGMDPYLEAGEFWPDFQQQFIAALYQTLLPGLVDRYRARVQTRHYVTDVALFTSVVSEQHREPYIEIRSRANGKLMTLVDVVSPSNRTTDTGRSAYMNTRQEAIREGGSTVEIDLIRDGQPILDFDRSGLPPFSYTVTVTRASHPGRFETYPTALDKPLPRFKLPLAADHQDTLVDLQTVFARAFDQGGFAERLDYSEDPAVPLGDDERPWLHELCKERGLR